MDVTLLDRFGIWSCDIRHEYEEGLSGENRLRFRMRVERKDSRVVRYLGHLAQLQ